MYFYILCNIHEIILNCNIFIKFSWVSMYMYFFLKKLHLYLYLLFTQNVVIVELLSAYFAFVEDDHTCSSNLAAAISLL